MARIKSKAQVRHRTVRKLTKGMRQARRRRVKAGKEALLHAGQYAYIGRKLKKRDLRSLWIIRMNAILRENGVSYSKFIAKLKKEKIELDRKILAEIAVKDASTFKQIIAAVK